MTPEIAEEMSAQNNRWETAYRVDTSCGLEYSLLRAHNFWFEATHK